MTDVPAHSKRYGQYTAKTDKHGLVNDMTKNQLNDLVEYLKSSELLNTNKAKQKYYHASLRHN